MRAKAAATPGTAYQPGGIPGQPAWGTYQAWAGLGPATNPGVDPGTRLGVAQDPAWGGYQARGI
jgi:hypothetical protein